MKLESSKSRLNNQKKKQIKGKSAKFAPVFIRNKANFKSSEISVSPFKKNKYQNKVAFGQVKSKPNQTQYKANSNPICYLAIFNISSFFTSKYEKVAVDRAKKTNPIKPNQTQFPQL